MRTLVELESPQPASPAHAPAAADLNVRPLAAGAEAEALAFLAARPVHTVYMAGFIRDNGLVSPLNRGTFYGCRDARGHLAGLALIGHVTQVEALSLAALCALARAAQGCSTAHVIMGEQATIRSFWEHYAPGGQVPRLACRELLLEQRLPVETAYVPGLRRATAADLELILPVQARMAEEECGLNPLAVDAVGFRGRCALRVTRGRVWVLVETGRLLFKADVMAETPEAVYLEGIWTHPDYRNRGIAKSCLTELTRRLLRRQLALCLAVESSQKAALKVYRQVGFVHCEDYQARYLQPLN